LVSTGAVGNSYNFLPCLFIFSTLLDEASDKSIHHPRKTIGVECLGTKHREKIIPFDVVEVGKVVVCANPFWECVQFDCSC
jgi:hypothetical protein